MEQLHELLFTGADGTEYTVNIPTKVITFKDRLDTKEDLPIDNNTNGDMYLIGLSSDDTLDSYVYLSELSKFIKLNSSGGSADLSDYYDKPYIDTALSTLVDPAGHKCIINGDTTGSVNEIQDVNLGVGGTIASNKRYVLTNPFGINTPVICVLELLLDGVWTTTNNYYASSSSTGGASAIYVQGEGIVIQTGLARVASTPVVSIHASSTITVSVVTALARVHVYRVGTGGGDVAMPNATQNNPGVVSVGTGLSITNGKLDNAINTNGVIAAQQIADKINTKRVNIFTGKLNTEGVYPITESISDIEMVKVTLNRYFEDSPNSEDYKVLVPYASYTVPWTYDGGSTPNGPVPSSGSLASLGDPNGYSGHLCEWSSTTNPYAMVTQWNEHSLYPGTNAITIYTGNCTVTKVKVLSYYISQTSNPVNRFEEDITIPPNSGKTIQVSWPSGQERFSIYVYGTEGEAMSLKGVILRALPDNNSIEDIQTLWMNNKELDFSKYGKVVINEDNTFTVSELSNQGYSITSIDAYKYIQPHHVPVGGVMEWYDDVPAPSGWLRDGGVDTSSYPALSSLMSVTPTYSDSIPRIICAEPSTGPVHIVDYYPKTIEEEAEAAGSWYRIWSNGFIEQNVITRNVNPHEATVAHLIPYTDIDSVSSQCTVEFTTRHTMSSVKSYDLTETVVYFADYNGGTNANGCTIHVYVTGY